MCLYEQHIHRRCPRPDSKLARAAPNSFETPSPTFYSTIRPESYYFGALAGLRKKLKFDPELLYIGPCFTTSA